MKGNEKRDSLGPAAVKKKKKQKRETDVAILQKLSCQQMFWQSPLTDIMQNRY